MDKIDILGIMENKKIETAVDWLYIKLLDIQTGGVNGIEINIGIDEFKKIFDYAKEIENEQKKCIKCINDNNNNPNYFYWH